MWRETSSLNFNSPTSKTGIRQIIIRGFLINILNLKLSIFFLAFLPLFVSPEVSSPTLQMILLSVIFMEMTLVIFILYGMSANSVRSYIANFPKFITRTQRSFAVIFAALGVKLALADQ